MKGKQKQVLDAAYRVQSFLDAQQAAIGDAVRKELRDRFDASVAALERFQFEQGSTDRNAQGETVTQRKLRDDVFDTFLAPIATAAAIGLKLVPEYRNLTAPAITKTKKQFVSRAREVAQAAQKYEAELISLGMAPDFIAKMNAAIDGVADSTTARGMLTARKSQATAGLDATEKSVRSYITLIGKHLAPVLKAAPDLAAGWRTARKIIRLPLVPLATVPPSIDASGSAAEVIEPAGPVLVKEDVPQAA